MKEEREGREKAGRDKRRGRMEERRGRMEKGRREE